MRKLWRLCGWGGATALALAALAIASRSDIGSEQLRLAFARPAAPAPAAATIPPQVVKNDIELRALEEQVRSLAADRDRLAERLASLEHHLDDVTGSIERQAAKTPAVAPASAQPPAARAPQAETAAPAPKPVATVPPAPATAVASVPVPPVIDPLAMPTPKGGSWPAPPPRPEVEAMAETGAGRAPSAEAQAPPLPPARLVALPPGAGEPNIGPRRTSKVEYGIELATGPSVAALRSRWSAVKANVGPMLGPLQPVAVRDPRPGITSYRLVAGPLPNFNTARQVCARFAAAHIACRPTRFDGQSMVQR